MIEVAELRETTQEEADAIYTFIMTGIKEELDRMKQKKSDDDDVE